jgi:protein arginine kinase activator
MNCEKCHKAPATVHVTEVANGVKREAHLCASCAQAAGVGIKVSFSISDILGNLVEPMKPGKPAERGATLQCPDCGLTYADFKAKARLGCSRDYEVFKAGLVPLLEKIHGATQHTGKVPPNADRSAKRENELAQLKRQLEAMVKAENFEKAAELRDRLKSLEQELDQA